MNCCRLIAKDASPVKATAHWNNILKKLELFAKEIFKEITPIQEFFQFKVQDTEMRLCKELKWRMRSLHEPGSGPVQRPYYCWRHTKSSNLPIHAPFSCTYHLYITFKVIIHSHTGDSDYRAGCHRLIRSVNHSHKCKCGSKSGLQCLELDHRHSDHWMNAPPAEKPRDTSTPPLGATTHLQRGNSNSPFPGIESWSQAYKCWFSFQSLHTPLQTTPENVEGHILMKPTKPHHLLKHRSNSKVPNPDTLPTPAARWYPVHEYHKQDEQQGPTLAESNTHWKQEYEHSSHTGHTGMNGLVQMTTTSSAMVKGESSWVLRRLSFSAPQSDQPPENIPIWVSSSIARLNTAWAEPWFQHESPWPPSILPKCEILLGRPSKLQPFWPPGGLSAVSKDPLANQDWLATFSLMASFTTGAH